MRLSSSKHITRLCTGPAEGIEGSKANPEAARL